MPAIEHERYELSDQVYSSPTLLQGVAARARVSAKPELATAIPIGFLSRYGTVPSVCGGRTLANEHAHFGRHSFRKDCEGNHASSDRTNAPKAVAAAVRRTTWPEPTSWAARYRRHEG